MGMNEILFLIMLIVTFAWVFYKLLTEKIEGA